MPPSSADRARRRAVRARASEVGVPYSVAARQLDAAGLAGDEMLAGQGRTVYPDPGLLEHRFRRPFAERVADSRRAAQLPAGRAEHLAERFPPRDGLYDGGSRQELIALAYRSCQASSPGLVPSVGELTWAAELGEETAVDIACALLDRAARLLLDDVAVTGVDGARHILDAVLIVGDDGHAPGTRVRLATTAGRGRSGTIVGVVWGALGPPVAYRVLVDGEPHAVARHPDELVVARYMSVTVW